MEYAVAIILVFAAYLLGWVVGFHTARTMVLAHIEKIRAQSRPKTQDLYPSRDV